MKKLFLTILFSAFLLLTNAQYLSNTVWQLQNPTSPANCEILMFTGDNTFYYSVINGQTFEKSFSQGTYEIVGASYLKLRFSNGAEITFYASEPVLNKTLVLSNDKGTLNFALSGSEYDLFMQNYVNNSYQNYNYYPSSSSTYTAPRETYTPCYTCHGVGSCVVCKGSGIYSCYGQSSTCSACNGTGKCWRCHGSGKE